ncbi:MAG TPA: SDR family NAD(P)-dependent oxidoreductase [Polyangiaceae bacterium]|nr:SDR family NAD(P)-dependent oxidoreductase [Polyangiaceae bacterium]
MTSLNQVRAVVTGGGGGLGRAIARALARRGGRVLVADVNLEGAEATAKLVEAGGGRAHARRADVSVYDDVARLAEEAERLWGGTDLLVNNAGVGIGGPLDAIPIDDWKWAVGVNFWGPVYGCQVFVPGFKRQGGGHILNVASAAGLLAAPEMAPYNATKAAVVALSETLHAELAPHKVGVTVLCPTFFQTDIVKSGRLHSSDGAAIANKLMSRAKLQADDVARLALEGVEADRLYVVPHPDGRWMWRLKRLAPEPFYHRLLPRIGGIRGRVAR